MTTLHVYNVHHGERVAMVTKCHPAADSFRPEEPWLLLLNSGRVDRFPTQRAAQAEARKTWGRVEFRKNAR